MIYLHYLVSPEAKEGPEKTCLEKSWIFMLCNEADEEV